MPLRGPSWHALREVEPRPVQTLAPPGTDPVPCGTAGHPTRRGNSARPTQTAVGPVCVSAQCPRVSRYRRFPHKMIDCGDWSATVP